MAMLRARLLRSHSLRAKEAPYDIQGVGVAFGIALLLGAALWAALIAIAVRML